MEAYSNFKNKLITTHVRAYRYGVTTEPSHMPKRHEKHQKWNPQRFMNWAKSIGPDVLIWVRNRLNEKPHPEQAYRVCLGLLNLTRKYEHIRLNNACIIANSKSLTTLRHIRSILNNNRDKLINQDAIQEEMDLGESNLPQSHENIRGPKAFAK